MDEREDEDAAITFAWDENKRAANLAKHGIDFVRIVGVFSDPRTFEYRSNRTSGSEERCVLIGTVGQRVVAVIYTRRGTTLRIISARIARKEERDRWLASIS